jgi:putative ABC transport system permease protein
MMLATFATDVRYAIRGLLARPLFALVAIGSLALGIGVNTAMFSLFQQVVLQPLPVHEPGRLVNLSAPGIKTGSRSSDSTGPQDDVLSHPMFRDLQRELPPQLVGIAGHRGAAITLGWQRQLVDGRALLVSGSYFEVLGLRPALGRLLDADDDREGAAGVVVLSHAAWLDRFGGRPDVVGETLRVSDQPMTVVGVAPAGFRGTTLGTRPDIFAPLARAPSLMPNGADNLIDRRSYWIYAFGRLSPAATPADAQAALNLPYARLLHEVELPLHADLDAERQQAFAGKQLRLSPGARGQSTVAASIGGPLRILFGIAALVLLIACLNIANLMLARGAARSGEFAIRASMGASRGRLLRQLLIESLLIALAGAIVSVPLAAAVASGLLGWLPPIAARNLDAELGVLALQFTAITALATVLLFGLFPALQLARATPMAALRGESGQAGSRGGNRFRAGLATAQIAFSMASLVLAGLFGKSLANISGEELGMQVDALAVFSLAPARRGYDDARTAVLYDRVEEELAALPGVTSVASSQVPLLANSDWSSNVSVEGHPRAEDDPSTSHNRVGVGFFDTLGIPMLAGRDFALTDNDGAAKVAIVNQGFVARYGLPDNPVGRRMAVGDNDDLDIEIIGLVADSKYNDVKAQPVPLFFLPRRQDEAGVMNFYVRTALPPETLFPQLVAAIARLDPNLPVRPRTVPQDIAQTIATERAVGLLSGAFALLSTLLAALGLYGVLSYTLSQRTREIGLRLALGAAPRRLAAMLLGHVGRMTLVGGLLGLGIALAAGRAAQSLLFGLQAHDPVVLAAAMLLLALVALSAAVLPARRAARIDPMTALRHD